MGKRNRCACNALLPAYSWSFVTYAGTTKTNVGTLTPLILASPPSTPPSERACGSFASHQLARAPARSCRAAATRRRPDPSKRWCALAPADQNSRGRWVGHHRMLELTPMIWRILPPQRLDQGYGRGGSHSCCRTFAVDHLVH